MKIIKIFTFLSLLSLGFFPQNSQAKAKHIVVIATGGTISGTGESAVGAKYSPGQLTAEKIINDISGISNLAKIETEQLLQISSQDLTSELWLKIAKRVNEILERKNVDGVVITHGTDTLEETAYFLNLTIKSKKPVILVGSMRPSTSLSADGPMNLYNAVALASSDKAIGKGVLVLMNDEIFAARDVTKTSTINVASFQARSGGAIGYVYYGKTEIYYQPLRTNTSNSIFEIKKLSDLPKVDIIYGYTNHESSVVDQLVASGSKAIILAGVGDGNISKETLQSLVEAGNQGVLVVRSSRVGSGLVIPNVEINDDKFGFLTADNLSPQKARILAMLALTKTDNAAKIQEIFGSY